MKKVSLIILNWNGWKMTLDCLRSLESVNCRDFKLEIVVVDNGSTDCSVDKIKDQRSIHSTSSGLMLSKVEASKIKTKIESLKPI